MKWWCTGAAFWLAGGSTMMLKQCLSPGYVKANSLAVGLVFGAAIGGHLVAYYAGIGMFGDA